MSPSTSSVPRFAHRLRERNILTRGQLASLEAFVAKHPGCRVEIDNRGAGFVIVRVRDAARGKLLMERHHYPVVN